MTVIGMQVVCELDGVSASPDVLGEKFNVTLPTGERFQIQLPTDDKCFQFIFAGPAAGEHSTVDPRHYEPTTALVRHGTDLVTIRLIQILVNVDAQLTAADSGPGGPSEAAADALLCDLMAKVLDVARLFNDWVRTSVGQHWIAPNGEFPRIVSACRLIDIDAGNRQFPSMIAKSGTIHILDPETILDNAKLNHVRSQIANAEPPPLDALVLAEARYLLSSLAPDRAILIAALAVELRSKRTLRTCATEAQRPLVDTLLDNPRDWSVAAAALLDKGFSATVGRSLKVDDRDLYKAVDVLFQHRNAVAHRGETFDMPTANVDVNAAVRVFDWLNGFNEASG